MHLKSSLYLITKTEQALIAVLCLSRVCVSLGRLIHSTGSIDCIDISSLSYEVQAYSHRKLRTPTSDMIDAIENTYLLKIHRAKSNETTERILDKYPTVQLLFTYNISLNAIALANVTNDDLTAILDDDCVIYAEREVLVKAMSTEIDLDSGRWGLARIDQRECVACDDATSGISGGPWNSSNHSYRYDYTGDGVQVFIIDSGIKSTHKEFMRKNEYGIKISRVSCGRNFRSDLNETCEDEWGHGTHVASIVGGKTVGVAKNVSLIAVKVIGADGSSRYSNIIAAIEFVIKRKRQNPNQPMVLNLSLGTPHVADLLNEAVNEAVANGLPVVVAAGNSNANACFFSPSSAKFAITVGASTKEDTLYKNSNWGECVDIYAPGAEIEGSWIGKTNGGHKVLSGTSMAAPFVSGAIALYLQRAPSADLFAIRKELFSDAVGGVLKVDSTENNSFNRTKILTSNLLLNVQSLLTSTSPSVAFSVERRSPTKQQSTTPTSKPTTQ